MVAFVGVVVVVVAEIWIADAEVVLEVRVVVGAVWWLYGGYSWSRFCYSNC